MINELDLLSVPNFTALGIFFFFMCVYVCVCVWGGGEGWRGENEETYTCFNVECVLLGRNFDLRGGYCSLPSDYFCLLLLTGGGYFWLLPVTGGYCLLLVVTARY